MKSALGENTLVKVICVAGQGPLLVMLIEYVRLLLTNTGSGASLWPKPRSAKPRTVVIRVGLLLPVFISSWVATRIAVSARLVGVVVLTRIVTLALALLVRVPTLH